MDHEDLEQLDEYDLEEMDLKWQVAMISMRMKKFYKKTGRKLQFDAKEPVGFDKTKVECYNCHKTGHFARECRIKGNQDNRRRDAWNSGNKDGSRTGKKEDSKALVTIDGEGVDWTSHSEEDEDYALMACNSSKSDTEVWSDAPIIEEYESDSEDEYVSIPTKQQETPSFANQQVKTPRETVKNQFTHSQKPKVDKKELGYGFTVRACFVCGSLNHLIRDCDFHEKRMAKKAELNNGLNRNYGQKEIRPIWNNVQRINKQNQFVPAAVLTRTGKIPVNTAKARPFKKTTVLSTNFSKQKVNTAKVNAVSAVGGKRETAVKPSAGLSPYLVYHSKTKHIAIRHHFIRDAHEKKLIQVLKIHNVADLLTKAFDVSRGLIGFRESLRRVIDGTEALLLPTLFILWLDTVSTDSAKLVPLGKVCTAIETLKKNTAKALISLLTTITLSTTMAVLDSCPKHNMVAYLEKTEGNAEFHEIIDFLTRSSIHHALTVSPVVSTTFVEQFWTSAKSKIINNVRHITAKVAGKPVSISEASIRSDLLFDDANGIDSLPNQAIFDAIQLMGYEGDLTVLTFNKALFSPQWRFLFHTMNHCISSKSTSWDQIPTNIATAVICLTSNQKYNFSKSIFDGMLRHLDAKKKFVMYPRFISILLDQFPVNTLTSKVFSFMVKKGKHFSGNVTPLFASMLVQPTEDEEASGGNLGGYSSSDKSLSGNEGAWMQKYLMTAMIGRKVIRKETIVQGNPLFDEIPEDTVDHMETENAQDEGRTREIVDEDKEIDENILSTEMQIEGTNEQIESTDKQRKCTDDHTEEGSDTQATQTPTSTIFGDDEINNRSLNSCNSDDEMARKLQEEWEGEEKKETIELIVRSFKNKKGAIYYRRNFKHSELKTKKFEEIQALYEKIKRSDEDFISIGSAEDERQIKMMNEKGIDSSKSEVIKEESKEEVQEESKEEESTRKRKLGTRKKMKSRKRRFIQNTSEDDSEKENDELRLHLTIAPDEERE
ncbi:ribonuclease H-like domain-containing protein [Tanacetum coccineum]